MSTRENAEMIRENTELDISLNTILYGPPGTGKTYHTVIYAVAVIENRSLASVEREDYEEVLRRYKAYREQGRIAFTTFHQSYGYEEFIDGIKPVPPPDNSDDEKENELRYEIKPGIFKAFCDQANLPDKVGTTEIEINSNPKIWKISLEGAGENRTREECLKNGHIRIGWDSYGKDITDKTDFSLYGGKSVLNAFINRMQIGDIVLSCFSASTIDAVGVITGEYQWSDEYAEFKRLRSVKWIVKDIREDILSANGGISMTLSSVYQLSRLTMSDVYRIIEKHKAVKFPYSLEKKKNYVFIIDEINRGNISKIFGELITLIEPSKRIGREEEMEVKLPYSQKYFGVPENVYLIGTMNTADRSIASIDTALRRRFVFREMLPDPGVLAGIHVDGISVSELLKNLNQRISLLYDRDHTIGHAFFMPLKKEPTVTRLKQIFIDHIIPLLQEYFYEDYDRIRLVLGDNAKKNEAEQYVIINIRENLAEIFGEAAEELEGSVNVNYEFNYEVLDHIETYRYILPPAEDVNKK